MARQNFSPSNDQNKFKFFGSGQGMKLATDKCLQFRTGGRTAFRLGSPIPQLVAEVFYFSRVSSLVRVLGIMKNIRLGGKIQRRDKEVEHLTASGKSSGNRFLRLGLHGL